jgi:hypothetical protein
VLSMQKRREFGFRQAGHGTRGAIL